MTQYCPRFFTMVLFLSDRDGRDLLPSPGFAEKGPEEKFERESSMKRTPAVLVGLSALGIVICCVAFSAVLMGGANENKQVLKSFYGKLAQGNGPDAYKQLHPELQAKIDPDLFDIFARHVSKELGSLKDITVKKFNKRKTGEGVFLEATALGDFEKGSADLEIMTRSTAEGPRLKKFTLTSPKLATWFRLPKDHSLYQKRSQRFVEALCSGHAQDAWDAMNADLRKSVGEKKFVEQVKKTLAVLGPSNKVILKLAKVKDETLLFTYQIDGRVSLEAVITISFPKQFRGEVTTYEMKLIQAAKKPALKKPQDGSRNKENR